MNTKTFYGVVKKFQDLNIGDWFVHIRSGAVCIKTEMNEKRTSNCQVLGYPKESTVFNKYMPGFVFDYEECQLIGGPK